MSTQATTANIPGLPPGAILKPIPAGDSGIQGLPPGAIVRPMAAAAGQADQGSASPASPGGNAASAAMSGVAEPYTGLAKSVAGTVGGIDQMVSKIPGVGKWLTTPLAGNESSQQAIQQERDFAASPDTLGEGVGEGVGDVGQFLLLRGLLSSFGEEAKGWTLAQKLSKIKPVLELAEQHPVIAKALQAAALDAATGGTLTLAKTGGDVPAAAESGALTGLLSGGLTGAGEEAEGALKKGATALQDKAREVLARQEGGKAAIAKSAQGATEKGLTPVYQTRMATPLPLPDIPAAVARTGSFGDAADELEGSAREAYGRLNQASNGQFSTARDAIKTADKQIARGVDVEGATARKAAAQQQIDGIFKAARGKVSPEDLQAANQSWRTAQTLRQVHSAVEGAFDTDAGFSARSGAYRGFNGDLLRRRLQTLTRTVGQGELERVVGRDQLDSLREVAEMNRTNADRARFGAATLPVMQYLEAQNAGVGGQAQRLGMELAGHAAARAIGLPVSFSTAGRVMKAIITNPKVAQSLVYAIRYGARPEYYGPLIGKMIEESQQPAPDSEGGEDRGSFAAPASGQALKPGDIHNLPEENQ